jgi:hypothetical protein
MGAKAAMITIIEALLSTRGITQGAGLIRAQETLSFDGDRLHTANA